MQVIYGFEVTSLNDAVLIDLTTLFRRAFRLIAKRQNLNGIDFR